MAGPMTLEETFHCTMEYSEEAGMSPPPIQKLVP